MWSLVVMVCAGGLVGTQVVRECTPKTTYRLVRPVGTQHVTESMCKLQALNAERLAQMSWDDYGGRRHPIATGECRRDS